MACMCDVGIYHLLQVFRVCHLVAVLTLLHYVLEPPQPILGGTEATGNRWPIWVANKAEIFGEEDVVDLLW